MANEFESFIKLELPLRPVLQIDGAEEAVLVRRGVGPRLFQLVTLEEGQVLGKSGGVIVGVDPSGGPTTPVYTGQILINENKEIFRVPATSFKSILTIVDLDDFTGDYTESYQVFSKPVRLDVHYTEYGNIGDSLNSETEVVREGSEVVMYIRNNWSNTLSYKVSMVN